MSFSSIKTTIFKLIIMLYSILNLTGCVDLLDDDYNGAHYTIKVSAMTNPSLDLKKYNKCYIIQKDKEDDLFNIQLINILENDLSQKEIKFVKRKKNANCLINAVWSISKQTTTRNVPIYNPYISSIQDHGPYGGTSFNYNYNLAGYSRIYDDEFVRILKLKAITKEGIIWQTEAISSGSSGDLRVVFPYLSLVSALYAKENLPTPIENNWPENLLDFEFYFFNDTLYRFKSSSDYRPDYYDQSYGWEKTNNANAYEIRNSGKKISFIKASLLLNESN